MSDSGPSEEHSSPDTAARRRIVGERNARTATGTEQAENAGCSSDDRCSDEEPRTGDATETAARLGYSADDAKSIEGEGALGLGHGGPQALTITQGETVVDLGSGAGFDCFLTTRAVGETGQVIGVHATPEMVERAQRTRRQTTARTSNFGWERSSISPSQTRVST